MITLQMPPAAAKQTQPAASTPANPANPANPATGDADPALAANKPSLFAFLLAQQTAAGAGAVPGGGKAGVTAGNAEEDTATEAKGGDPSAAAPWMWLHTALPRDAACKDPKSLTPAGTASALEAAGTAGAQGPLPGSAGAQALAAAPDSPTAHSAGVGQKNAADEFAALSAATEPSPQRHGTETPLPQLQAQPANEAAPAPAAKAAPVEVPIESKVGTPRWTRDIHQSVTMLVQARASVAELRLTPADMGPIQIRIDFSDKQPSVSISVQQTDTRNALDAALPRLREMMAESGITLGGAGVEQHGRPGDAPGDQARFAWQGRDGTAASPAPVADPFIPAARPIAIDQLVDTYA
jgi:flagellar hook-length control protein FliK